MPLSKRLQKLGNSRVLLLDREMLGLLNLEQDDEPEVTLTYYGDTLVLRRAGSLPMDLQQVGQVLGLSAWDAVALPKPLDFGDVLPALREVLEMLEDGPMTVAEMREYTGLEMGAISTRLSRLRKLEYVVKEGNRYGLNREMFGR